MRWIVQPNSENQLVEKLKNALEVDSVISQLLVRRGVNTFDQAKNFFRPSIESLHDPYLMADMEKAANRVAQAIGNEESILIYGDYDVDGTTAVALMIQFLKSQKANVQFYIPDRHTEGYGVSHQGMTHAIEKNCSLIICLDCGIKALKEIQFATENQIDVIVCDHHTPGKRLPNAFAILDPKRHDCSYPFDGLSGCGVGFKLIQAIAQKKGIPNDQLIPYLDLLAISIAADIVPMVNENRILMNLGLKEINKRPRMGVQKMLQSFEAKTLKSSDIVFKIAPRINAAGRIGHGSLAVRLLLDNDPSSAQQLANEIETYNNERKHLDHQITLEVLKQIEEKNELKNKTTIAYNSNWHKGVIGIVASRAIEKHYRPTIIFAEKEGLLVGSARSIHGFNIYKALEKCSALLEQFGGHQYAAGMTLKKENYSAFKKLFEKTASELLTDQDLIPSLKADMEIELNQITEKTIRILSQFAPFGPRNMRPIFFAHDVRKNGFIKQMGASGKHIKFNVLQGNSKNMTAVGFNFGHLYNQLNETNSFSMAFSIDQNQWKGNTYTQLIIRDLKFDQ